MTNYEANDNFVRVILLMINFIKLKLLIVFVQLMMNFVKLQMNCDK